MDGGVYRWGFQGQEKDDEIKGAGNSINYKYRAHDSRIGRFLSLDPLAPEYPFNSPYAFSENRVIDGIDLEGKEYVSYKIRFVDGVMKSKVMTHDYREVSSKLLNMLHHDKLKGKDFYEIYSRGFGSQGRGIAYTYEYYDSKTKQTTMKTAFFNKDKGLGYHGIYYGPGCPTKCGPAEKHDFKKNPYDYSLDPLDGVDEIAKQHDKDYDFESYGDGFSILPHWLTDERTLEADQVLLKSIRKYLNNAKDPDFVDPVTGRKPSEEAIRKGRQMRFFFKNLIIPNKKGIRADIERAKEKAKLPPLFGPKL